MLRAKEIDELLVEVHSLLKSGVPLPEGLRAMESSTAPRRIRRAARLVSERLEQGESVPEAFERAKIGMPEHSLAVLRCAADADGLAPLVRHATEHGRRIRRHHHTMASAFIYPSILFMGILGLIAFIALLITPRFVDIFGQLGAELPQLTLTVIALSELLATVPGMFLLLLCFALAGLLLIQPLVVWLVGKAASIPGLGALASLSDTILLGRYVSLLLRRGLPLHEALRAAKGTLTLGRSRHALDTMAKLAEAGQPIAREMPTGTPSTAVFLMERGEQHGDLPGALEGIAEYCEQQFDLHSKRAAVLLEPLLLFAVAVVIGIVVFSLYLPLFYIPRLIV